ncbi:MAG: hypothetical protein OXC40_03395, partial [Proteobacteria bacterium]|nr:hypothetical protein [Pseudomonadota bacterium]
MKQSSRDKKPTSHISGAGKEGLPTMDLSASTVDTQVHRQKFTADQQLSGTHFLSVYQKILSDSFEGRDREAISLLGLTLTGAIEFNCELMLYRLWIDIVTKENHQLLASDGDSGRMENPALKYLFEHLENIIESYPIHGEDMSECDALALSSFEALCGLILF